MNNALYEIELTTIDNCKLSMQQYKGYVILVVNTASKCGFTPQYEELQELYQKYKDQKFVILGFPCDQFGHQEPGNNNEIMQFCELNYGVSFPLFAKIEVNGDNTHPLFQLLKDRALGWFFSKKIWWNFSKFLINRNGSKIKHYSPFTNPKSFENKIVEFLNK